MNLLEKFRAEVEDFLTDTGMNPTAFGKTVLGDPGFVFQLREGRSPHVATIDKVHEFMRTHRRNAGEAA